MSPKSNNSPGGEKPSAHEHDVVTDRVQELTWALLDECGTEEDVALLDNLLLSDASARKSYIDCILLHTDLMAHFADDGQKPGQKLPVLGFLSQDMPAGFPSAEELK